MESIDFTQPVNCELFNGYKPCAPFKVCPGCPDRKPIEHRILVVNLDAIGNVIQNTSLLPAIRRKYPNAHIDWLTRRQCAPALENNPYLYRVWVFDWETALVLQSMEYDLVLSCDKSRPATAFVESLKAKEKRGYGLSGNGAIRPLNPEAVHLYRMGVDDALKFNVNQRSGQDLLAEALVLPYERDEYVLELAEAERYFIDDYRHSQGLSPEEIVIGFNTGCSSGFPNKKMRLDQFVDLINRFEHTPGVRVALLGGPDETARNEEIARQVRVPVIATPTNDGLRRGILYIAACDIVVTGCTSAMHMAIGLKKHVVAWFGPSCASEVDLYGRGEKIVQKIPCSPCWKPACDDVICRDTLDIADYEARILRTMEVIRRSRTRLTPAEQDSLPRAPDEGIRAGAVA